MGIVAEKRCNRCKETKPRDQFDRWALSRDGLQQWCKACTKAYRALPEVRERQNALFRERYATDPQFRAKIRQTTNARTRARYAVDQNYRQRKDAQKRELIRHSETWQEKVRYWGRRHSHRRRMQQEASPTRHSRAEWEALCKQHGDRCVCCGEQKPLTVDHIVPLSKGGSDGIENIQPLCKPCNSQKSDKTIDYRPHVPTTYRQLALEWEG